MSVKLFRFRRTANAPWTSATSGSRLRFALICAGFALGSCVVLTLGGLAARQFVRHLRQAETTVATESSTALGEGHVRRFKSHQQHLANTLTVASKNRSSPSTSSAIESSHASRPGQDWSEFRGPGGQGHSQAKGLPIHWSRTENVTWKTPIPGKGWSSPVTSGDRIFVTTAIETGQTHELHALGLDAASGEIEWDATVFDRLDPAFVGLHAKNSYATPTPLTDGDRIYVHFGPHGSACLALDGETIWKTRELKYEPSAGGAGSPVLVNGLLIISCDGTDRQFVVGLDVATGKIRWKTNRQPSAEAQRQAFTTPLVIDVDGKKQVVSSGASDANSYDPDTGADLWRVNYGGFSTVSRPVFGNGIVYLAAGHPLLMAIRPDGQGEVTKSHVVWTQNRSIPKCPSPLLVNDSLYLVEDNGIATCINARTGKPRWTHRMGGAYATSPLFASGKIYVVSEDGATVIFDADPKQFTQVAKNKLDEQCLATPAVIDGALLIRTRTSLYRIENR